MTNNRCALFAVMLAGSGWTCAYSPAAFAEINQFAKILNNCTPASGVRDTTARYIPKDDRLQITVDYFGVIEMAVVALSKLASVTYAPGKGLEFRCDSYEVCVGVAPVSQFAGKYKLENDVVAQDSFLFVGCRTSALQDAADEFNN